MIRKHFRLKRIALGLAFAAVAAPTAQATPNRSAPEIQSGVNVAAVTQHRSVGLDISPQVSPYELGPAPATHVLPGALTLAPVVVRSENSFGAPGPSAAGATGPQVVPVVNTSDGFNWSDAGIGALVAFGAALALLTAVSLSRRNRNRTRLASA